jgi:hypothetical protein
MENLLTIGEFAEATRISPKAVRLYAENGLLAPARVDGDSELMAEGADGAPREVYRSAPGEPDRWEVAWPLR